MLICVGCKREMSCIRTGMGADFGHGHIYAGDIFQCFKCEVKIAKCNGYPGHDPEHKYHDMYIDMTGKEEEEKEEDEEEEEDIFFLGEQRRQFDTLEELNEYLDREGES